MAVAPQLTKAMEERDRTSTLLIDTDVHEGLRSPLDLVPYLDAKWKQYWEQAPRVMLPGAKPMYAIPAHVPVREDWKQPDGGIATDLDAMRRVLFDGEGVSIAILNNFAHLGTTPTSPEFNVAICRAYTDWQIENWLEKESRLRGSVYVFAHDPVAAAKEIDRAAAHPQIVQVFLPTVTDREYGDPMYRPIFEAAVRNGLVVAMHHGGYTAGQVGWQGWPRYFIQWHNTAQWMAAANQLTSLVCNGIFEHLPELKVVFLETGVGWIAPFIWRFDQQYRELRSEVPWVKRLPSEHIREHVRFSTQPMADLTSEQFRQLVEMSDSAGLYMFSTDYPHYDADSADIVLPRTLPEELRRRVRYQNAIETYPRLAGAAA
jgi:predicted TIM-barrel fold metal-dependent hydrolase